MAIADMTDFAGRGVSPSLPAEERKRRNLEQLVKNYYRTLLTVDENVGRVLDALDARNLAADTVVVYTSDNGFFLGEHGLFDKRLMYEPSIRVPFLVRFPARLPAGIVDSRHMVLNVDLAPTLMELAGLPVPPGLHGRSLVPLLERTADFLARRLPLRVLRVSGRALRPKEPRREDGPLEAHPFLGAAGRVGTLRSRNRSRRNRSTSRRVPSSAAASPSCAEGSRRCAVSSTTRTRRVLRRPRRLATFRHEAGGAARTPSQRERRVGRGGRDRTGPPRYARWAGSGGRSFCGGRTAPPSPHGRRFDPALARL